MKTILKVVLKCWVKIIMNNRGRWSGDHMGHNMAEHIQTRTIQGEEEEGGGRDVYTVLQYM